MTLLIPATLFLTLASLIVVGGAIFALFLFFPLFCSRSSAFSPGRPIAQCAA